MDKRESGEFVELEFSLADDAYPAVRVSEALGCRLDLLDAVQADDGAIAAFFHVDGAEPDQVVGQGRAAVFGEDVRILDRFGDECTAVITMTRCVFGTLANARVPLRSLVVTDGTARFVATMSGDRTPSDVVSAVRAQHPSVEFVAKRRLDVTEPFRTPVAFQALLDQRLTDRQFDALQTAYENGYFERPREVNQRDLAERMDISPSTFGQHLNAALRKLLAVVFHDQPGAE